MKRSNAWHLRDIILLALIAIFCGVIFWVIGPLYNILTVALTPVGLGPAANDILMGVWCMAGPLAGIIFKRVGAAFLGEFLGSVVEMFLGGQWGASTMISGVVQGVASELGFTFTGYKNFNWFGAEHECPDDYHHHLRLGHGPKRLCQLPFWSVDCLVHYPVNFNVDLWRPVI